ncbi:CPBP family intramembrane glutamic endopeptidase [Streptosporangium sp. NPDC000396]|uniref:CPBP family intramembrane glutamic endopeptidase n=1 Tax=Streptosporangium sp. NPDC000396 TaxID=3366185 RepID=UPI0036A9172C
MTALPWPLRALVLAALVLLYYKYAKTALFAACRRAAHLLPFAGRWDASERGSVLELAAAGASHVLVVILLALVTGIDVGGLPTGWNRPDLIGLGAAIGVGEVALGSLLCRVLIEGVQARGRRHASARALPATAAGQERMRQWLGLSRGGWIRHHLKTMEVVSLPLAVMLTAVQVGSEEVVFRGLMLTWLRDAGPLLAIGLSCLLFTVMQVFLMSSWRAAMFPVVGAIVMGVTHSVLYWHYPALIPLMVAHVTFFLFAVA